MRASTFSKGHGGFLVQLLKAAGVLIGRAIRLNAQPFAIHHIIKFTRQVVVQFFVCCIAIYRWIAPTFITRLAGIKSKRATLRRRTGIKFHRANRFGCGLRILAFRHVIKLGTRTIGGEAEILGAFPGVAQYVAVVRIYNLRVRRKTAGPAAAQFGRCGVVWLMASAAAQAIVIHAFHAAAVAKQQGGRYEKKKKLSHKKSFWFFGCGRETTSWHQRCKCVAV